MSNEWGNYLELHRVVSNTCGILPQIITIFFIIIHVEMDLYVVVGLDMQTHSKCWAWLDYFLGIHIGLRNELMMRFWKKFWGACGNIRENSHIN